MSDESVERSGGRVEDPAFLTGRARYLADLIADGSEHYDHVRIIRSEVAHGHWQSVELTSGLAPDVDLIGLDRFARLPNRVPVVWHLGDQTHDHSLLADPHVRYVGQPVGLLVGADQAAVADAVERVTVEIDPLPPVATVDDALAVGAATIHEDRIDNVLADFTVGDPPQELEAAMAAADHVVEATFEIGRLAGSPMEPRGLAARLVGDRLEIVTSTQAPHAVRDAVASVLGWPRRRIRVRAVEVGGGFGVKDHPHDDELLVAATTALTGRPLVWLEDRAESLTVTTQARDERHRLKLGLDRDGRFLALTVDSVRNGGAHFAIFGGGPLFSCLGMRPGPYRIHRYAGRGRVVATTTVPTAAYRGFGQTQAAYIRERLIDRAARRLDLDPVELRRRNLIDPEEQPWTNRAGIQYDNGDYRASLDAAQAAAETWPPPPDDGRRYGVGFATYVQMAGLGPSTVNAAVGLSIGGYETAEVTIDPDGQVEINVGTVPHGQGHGTAFGRIVADRLGLDWDRHRDRIVLAAPDTDRSPYSPYGTAASRSMAVGGAAIKLATDRVAEQLRTLAADELEAAPVDIELIDGAARVRGGGGQVSIETLAGRAWRARSLPDGQEPGLWARVGYDPVSCTFSFGTHVCRVAVDPETGAVEIDRYHVVQDCGTVIDRAIVAGQTHGGIAQGATAAVLEEVRFDESAQPLTGSLASYLVPDTGFLPAITIDQTETPSPHTPGGMKGIGEGGTNGSFAAVANAVIAAVPEVDEQLIASPFSPERVWFAMAQAATPARAVPG